MTVRTWEVDLRGLLAAAGWVACLGTVLGFYGRTSWILDLFSHFRIQYLLGLGVLSALLAWGRWRRTAGVFLAFFLVNAGVVGTALWPARAPRNSGSVPLRILLVNVNTRQGDPEKVRAAVERLDPDVIVLQEISTRWVRDLAPIETTHPHVLVEPRDDNFGIGIYSRHPLSDARVVWIGEAEVPSLVARIRPPGAEATVVATHPVPPVGRILQGLRNEQLARLPEVVPGSGPVVLVGDLNTTPWNPFFRDLVRATGLVDSGRGRLPLPTWPTAKPALWIPIDHLLHSPDVVTTGRRLGPRVGSDHFPVVVDLRIPTHGSR